MRDATPTFPIGTVDLSSGPTLTYLEEGSLSGIPVVLLHGIGDSMRAFDLLLPHLPDSMHAFALSQRGHGDSSRPASGYRPADFAGDVRAFLDAVGVSRAVIVGHSMGSWIAQQFAVDHPDRTLGLVLVGAFATVAGSAAWLDIDRAVAGFADTVDREFVVEFQASTLARRVPDAFFDLVVRESLKMPARVWRQIATDFLAAPRIERGAIRTPTLVVWGDRDAYCPRAHQDSLLATIPRARLEIYAGAGHALHWEEPARFVADLAAFVETLEVGGRARARDPR